MRILILGGYGFIGLEIARRLSASGHEVMGLGRSAETGRRLLPGIKWISVDIAALNHPTNWHNYLVEIDVVINASGALQSHATNKLAAIQGTAIVALVSACEVCGVRQFVQISAPGATSAASTEFMRTKAEADSKVRTSALDWTVLRPGLVIGPNAYGGTALIRMLASVPFIQPLVFGDRLVQTVSISDLTEVVHQVIEGNLPVRSEFDLLEDKPHSLKDLVRQTREWLGFAPACMQIEVPAWLAGVIAKGADTLAYLGWRSPLRTTTLKLIAENIVGDSEPYRRAEGKALSTLEQTLGAMPATLQERWFARLYLIMPLIMVVLSAFWLITGLIAIFNLDEASILIADEFFSPRVANLAVLGGAVADIVLGGAVLYRPWARRACFGMVAVTLLYLFGGTVLRPDLWIDPLGPLLKAVPAMMLAVAASILLETR